MTWHYLEGQEQRGPVTEADLEALARSGKITNETYVWREGMAQWQPYGQVKAPPAAFAPAAAPGGVICSECGRSFPPDQVIRHGNASICAACKPVFLQKLKEGVTVSGALNYAGFWIRFGAKLLDIVVLAVVTVPTSLALNGFQPSEGLGFARFGVSTTINLLVGAAYYTVLVGKFGATVGKMAAGLKIVNPDGTPVSYAKAAGRFFAAEYISGCFTLGIGYLMIAWDDEKRALHDRICATRVIKK